MQNPNTLFLTEAPSQTESQEVLKQLTVGEAFQHSYEEVGVTLKAEQDARLEHSMDNTPDSATTLEKATENLHGAGAQFQALLESNPQVTPGLYERHLSEKIDSLKKVYGRLDIDEARAMIKERLGQDLQLALLQQATLALPQGRDIEAEAFNLAMNTRKVNDSPMAELFDNDKLETLLEAQAHAVPDDRNENVEEEPLSELPVAADNPQLELVKTDVKDQQDMEGESKKIAEFDKSLEAMRFDFMDLATFLRSSIENHTWTSIIGDDVSGRLPTLFVHRLMQRYGEATHTSTPPVLFAAPDRSPTEEKVNSLKSYFEYNKSTIGNRPLVVTEFIASGDSVRQLNSALPRGAEASVAALTVSPYTAREDFGLGTNNMGFKELYHASEAFEPPLYGARAAAGTEKDSTTATSHRHTEYDATLVGHAREKITQLADEAFNEVFMADGTLLAAA